MSQTRSGRYPLPARTSKLTSPRLTGDTKIGPLSWISTTARAAPAAAQAAASESKCRPSLPNGSRLTISAGFSGREEAALLVDGADAFFVSAGSVFATPEFPGKATG